MDKMEKQEKKDIEDKIALTQFSRELELLLLGILLGGIVLIRCLRQIRQYSQDCRRLASQRHERLEEKIAELHQKYDSKFLAPSVVSYTIVADIFLIGLTILLWLLSRSFSTESYAYALILLVVQHYPIVLFSFYFGTPILSFGFIIAKIFISDLKANR